MSAYKLNFRLEQVNHLRSKMQFPMHCPRQGDRPVRSDARGSGPTSKKAAMDALMSRTLLSMDAATTMIAATV